MKVSITDTELEILQLLWDEGRPLSKPELIQRLTLPDNSKNSIHFYLRSMLEKGVIKVAGTVICGKRPGRTYAPAITREEYTVSQLDELVPRDAPLKGFINVLSCWIDTKPVDQETIAELEALIAQKRKELNEK